MTVVYNPETEAAGRKLRRIVYSPHDSRAAGRWVAIAEHLPVPARCSAKGCGEKMNEGDRLYRLADGSMLCPGHGAEYADKPQKPAKPRRRRRRTTDRDDDR